MLFRSPEIALEVQAVSVPGEALGKELLLTVTASPISCHSPVTLKAGSVAWLKGLEGFGNGNLLLVLS